MENDSIFSQVNVLMKVALLPHNTAHPMDAIKNQVNSMLFRYNEELRGIPVLYSQLKLPKGKEYGKILGEQPWIHIDIETKVLVFKPDIGACVKGKINVVSDSHIGMLVYGMFNASISSTELASRYKYDAALNIWSSSSEDLAEGSALEFRIMRTQYANGVLNMEGALV